MAGRVKRMSTKMALLVDLGSWVFVSNFSLFLLALGRSKNWIISKAGSWKHYSMSFSASRF
jgi:hypothetical protein